MTDLNELFPDNADGDFLKAEHIPDGQTFQVTIGGFEIADMPTFDDPAVKEKKLIIKFLDYDKSAVLNNTNRKNIMAVYGAIAEDWTGKPVLLSKAMKSNDKMGIVVEPPKTIIAPPRSPQHYAAEQTATHNTTQTVAVVEDDIPF